MKLANLLLVLAIIATASAIYLGRRDPAFAAPAPTSSEQLSTEVVELRRELAAIKAQIALLQKDRTEPREPPATDPQQPASGTSQQ